jgi:glycosyltransferase involved in cell wall biosynthesis
MELISTERIKVLHVLHSVGGVDVYLRTILGNLNAEKIESIVVHGLDDSEKQFLNSQNGVVKEYKLPIIRNINIIFDLKALIGLIRIVRLEKPNLIHAHSAKGGVIGKLVGKILNVPVLHTPHAYSYLSTQNSIKKKLFLLIEKSLVFKGNKILATSNSEKIRAIKDVGYKEINVITFNNSIKPILNIKTTKINKTWPDKYICSVGRPSFQKNIELMLHVLHEIRNKEPDIHLVLMGVGYYAPRLREIRHIINELKLEKNITLLEWTTQDQIFRIIQDSVLYLSTARYEGLPLSIIESLAIGKPVVATDVDGNRDLIINGFNGFLVEQENTKKIAAIILRILNDETITKKFSQNSKLLFEQRFNIENNINYLEKIYVSEALEKY